MHKASITLIKKMVHYTQPTLLASLDADGGNNFFAQLEVVAAVVDPKDDEDGTLLVFFFNYKLN